MDCMRLFTKEDVLDGDEKPVSPLPWEQEQTSKRPPWERAVTSRCSLGVTGLGPSLLPQVLCS